MPRNKKEQRQEEIMYALHGGTSSPDPYDELIAAEAERERDMNEARLRSYVKKLKKPHRLAIQLTFGFDPYGQYTVRQAGVRMGMSTTHAQRQRTAALEQLRLRYGLTSPASKPALRVVQGGATQNDANEIDEPA